MFLTRLQGAGTCTCDHTFFSLVDTQRSLSVEGTVSTHMGEREREREREWEGGRICVCVGVCIPSAALEYLKSHPVGEVDEEEFSRYSGVGVLVTPQQIHDQVCTLLTLATHAQRGLL